MSSLASRFLTFGSVTLISRFSGLLRDLVTANLLGAGRSSDAFFVAFRIPNMLRTLFAEGAFSSAFVPMYSSKRIKKEDASGFVRLVFWSLLLVSFLFSCLCYLLMPKIVATTAPGLGEYVDKATKLGRIMMPYAVMACMSAIAGGILQSMGKVAFFAFTSVILNVCMIVGAVYLPIRLGINISEGIARSVRFAGFIQCALMVIVLFSMGFRMNPFPVRWDKDFLLFWKRLTLSCFSPCIARINLWTAGFLASSSSGAISHLYYAERLQQLPIALIGIGISSVILAPLSTMLASKNISQALDLKSKAIEAVIAMSIPSTVFLIMTAEETVSFLFVRGSFLAMDAAETARILKIICISIPAVICSNVITSFFFAAGDVKVPTISAIICSISGVTLNFLLFYFFNVSGIAASVALSPWISLTFLLNQSRKKNLFTPGVKLATCLKKISVATSVAACIFLTTSFLLDHLPKTGFFSLLLIIFLKATLFGVLYIFSLKKLAFEADIPFFRGKKVAEI